MPVKSLLLITTLLVCSGCNHLFYYPTDVKYVDPKKFGYDYVDKYFTTGPNEAKLHAWYFPARKKSTCGRKLVVHFHGNAQNLTSHFSQLLWVTDQGFDYLIFDYPGYGQSNSEASRKLIHQSAVRLLEKVQSGEDKDLQPQDLILYGQSLGGAVLMGALAESKKFDRVQLVVLEGTFVSYKRIARRKLAKSAVTWPLQWLAYLLVSDATSADDLLKKTAFPRTLVLHGNADRTVEPIEGQDIYEKLNAKKELWLIPGAGHLQVLAPTFGVRERLVKEICQGAP